MRNETRTKIERIKKVSLVFRRICFALLALLTLIGTGSVLDVVLGVGGINYEGLLFQTAGLSMEHRLVLGSITAVAWAVLFKCFFHLQRLFGIYSRGEIFTRPSVGQLRQFGIACLLWGCMNFVWILSLALSTQPAATYPAHADSIVIGTVIVAIAWFMDIAVDLQEENELTI